MLALLRPKRVAQLLLQLKVEELLALALPRPLEEQLLVALLVLLLPRPC